AILATHAPRVIRAESDLVLGQDHPVALLATDLAPLELEAVRQHGARQGNRNRCAGAEIPGAADDLARLAVADVDDAQLEPVCVRMLPRLEHAPNPEEPEVAVGVGDADGLDSTDLRGRDQEPFGNFPDRPVEWHGPPQP